MENVPNNMVMGQKPPRKESAYTPDEFEHLQIVLRQSIRRMCVIQSRLDRRIFTTKKFMYEDELNKLIKEVDICTRELKRLKLKDEKKNRKILAGLMAMVVYLFSRLYFMYLF